MALTKTVSKYILLYFESEACQHEYYGTKYNITNTKQINQTTF